MRILVLLALTFLVSGAHGSASVPCTVFGNLSGCPNPIVQGVVDGQWVGLIYHFDGTNGGPDSISVVVVGVGGNGYSAATLQVIRPESQYGDRMTAQFVDGKLWVENALYLPGEAHCCYTHTAVRQFGFHAKRLQVELAATVPNGATNRQIRAALKAGPQIR
jgi:hypothetical protein